MMIWPDCNLGRRWTRLSPAPRVAAASRNTPATRCSLRFIAGTAARECSETASSASIASMGTLSSRSLEMTVEEIARRVIGRQPILMQQKIVDVIGENELLDLDALLAEACDEIHSLGEIDVAVIVAVNEQDGGLPGIHGRYRRRFMRELVELRLDIFSVPVVGWPVMHAV